MYYTVAFEEKYQYDQFSNDFEINYKAVNQDQVIKMVRKYLQERYDKQDIEISCDGMYVRDTRYGVAIRAISIRRFRDYEKFIKPDGEYEYRLIDIGKQIQPPNEDIEDVYYFDDERSE